MNAVVSPAAAIFSFRRARKSEPAGFSIQRERARTGDLGEPPRCRKRLEVELKEPVARDDIAQGAIRVLFVRGEDVWHGAIIVLDVHRRAQAYDGRTRAAWQLSRTSERPHPVRGFEKRTKRRGWADAACADEERAAEHGERADEAEEAGCQRGAGQRYGSLFARPAGPLI